MKRLVFVLLISSAIAITATAGAVGEALVTVCDGNVGHTGGGVVTAFSRLHAGDRLALGRDSRLRLVYVFSGRQEAWEGPGEVEIGIEESKGAGARDAGRSRLTEAVARQIARTPSIEGAGRSATRTRAVPTPAALSDIDDTYRKLRAESAADDDLSPEMYALSAYMEIRATDRVEQMIGELRRNHPKDASAKLLAGLYQRALRNAKEAASGP